MARLIPPMGECPRCGGSFYREDDSYGAYRGCLACGFVEYPDGIAAEREPGERTRERQYNDPQLFIERRRQTKQQWDARQRATA